jgi:hypothetical protein
MSIRKTGAADGRVTQVEGAPGQAPQAGIAATASVAGPNPPWAEQDEAALLAENEEADQA